MNKESIYRIIGYNGEYNANVKKAIRKLLKENHPDKNGDPKIFELINEVKEELENNKVTYKIKTNNKTKHDFIDYDYCREMIIKIKKEKNIYTKDLERVKDELEKIHSDYKKNYRKSIDLETYILSNAKYTDKLKKTKNSCVIFLILTIIMFLISIWKKNIIFFAIFVILVIICVITIREAFYIMHKITSNSQNQLSSYVKTNSNLRDNIKKQEELKKEMNEITKKINNLENDLRFYNNII